LKNFISTLSEDQLQAMCDGYVNNWINKQENNKHEEEFKTPAKANPAPEDALSDEMNNTFGSVGDET
jgi:hypothetical protein